MVVAVLAADVVAVGNDGDNRAVEYMAKEITLV